MDLTGVTEIADKAMDFADDSFESREEAEATRTRRLEIDTTSPFKLPHLIRPISFIWTLSLETLLTLAVIGLAFSESKFSVNVSNTVMAALASNTTVLLAQVGFYFNGRKAEKINAKKAAAAVEIEYMKEKTKDKENKRMLREKRKSRKKEDKA